MLKLQTSDATEFVDKFLGNIPVDIHRGSDVQVDPESRVGNKQEEINASNKKSCDLVLQNDDELDSGKEKLVETVRDIPETKDDVIAQHKENLPIETNTSCYRVC